MKKSIILVAITIGLTMAACESLHIGSKPTGEPGKTEWVSAKDSPEANAFVGVIGSAIGAITGTGPAPASLLSGLMGLLGGRIWMKKDVSKGILAIEKAKANGVVDFNAVGSDIKASAGVVFNSIVDSVKSKHKEATKL